MPVLHERTPGSGAGGGGSQQQQDAAKKRYSLPAHFANGEPPYARATPTSGIDTTIIPNLCCKCVKNVSRKVPSSNLLIQLSVFTNPTKLSCVVYCKCVALKNCLANYLYWLIKGKQVSAKLKHLELASA